MIVGNLPIDLGLVDLNPTEMIFWLYCPIKIPGQILPSIPDNLRQFEPLIRISMADFGLDRDSTYRYVYITAKTLYVDGKCTGQRPGWHCDGFGTDDINYLWYTNNPTQFYNGPQFEVSEDCEESIKQMEEAVENARREPIAGVSWPAVKYFPIRHLLRLDPTTVHRTMPIMSLGIRTFVKISISKNRYNLEGNSINHLLPEFGNEYFPRNEERNHPCRDFETK